MKKGQSLTCIKTDGSIINIDIVDPQTRTPASPAENSTC